MGDESSGFVQILGLVIGLLYLGVWITISVRLLRTAARTRMAPEIAMGAYFTLLTTSHLLGIPSLLLKNAEHPLASTVSAAALFCFFPAALALAIGTWRMFRPASRWPIALCIVLSVQMGAAWWLTVRSGEVVSLFTTGTPNLIFTMGRTAIYAWAFGEAFQYYRTAQKRVALGLADPVVAERILLWGIAALALGASSVLIAVTARVGVLAADGTPESGLGLLSLPLSLIASAAVWCAFYPPRFYSRWRESRLAVPA